MDQSFTDIPKHRIKDDWEIALNERGYHLASTTPEGHEIFKLPHDHPTNRAHWVCMVPTRKFSLPKNPSKFHKLFFGGILRKPLLRVCQCSLQLGYFFLNLEVSLEESLALYAKNRIDGKGSE